MRVPAAFGTKARRVLSRRAMQTAVACALVVLGAPTWLHAQRLQPIQPEVRAQSALVARVAAPRRVRLAADSGVARRSYALQGGLAGGLLVGAAAAAFARGMCSDPDSGMKSCGGATMTGFIGGGVVGFLVGAAVGSLYRKPATAGPR